ncbi:hypothetical protein [Paenibacillus sp. HB172176]|uniref:hypothetical protein n=1 Tax=Paenibacillus sp. HB172176 TaxID=2493690 RepID=UPI00143ABC49|nr:hypothetical protein [Paenibacillus sp. HB172176]
MYTKLSDAMNDPIVRRELLFVQTEMEYFENVLGDYEQVDKLASMRKKLLERYIEIDNKHDYSIDMNIHYEFLFRMWDNKEGLLNYLYLIGEHTTRHYKLLDFLLKTEQDFEELILYWDGNLDHIDSMARKYWKHKQQKFE